MGDRGMGVGQKHRQRQRETRLGVGITWTICGMPSAPPSTGHWPLLAPAGRDSKSNACVLSHLSHVCRVATFWRALTSVISRDHPP